MLTELRRQPTFYDYQLFPESLPDFFQPGSTPIRTTPDSANGWTSPTVDSYNYQISSELLREPDLAPDLDCGKASPRLLRESGSTHDFAYR